MATNQASKLKIRGNIITLFGIDKMPEEKQEEMISRIGGIIFQGVLARILPLLEEKELAEYNKLIAEGAEPDALLDFFFENVPSFMQIVTEESENFRKDAAEVLDQIK